MKLIPLGDSIFFTFAEASSGGMFVPKSSSGIIMTNLDISHNKSPKWGKVLLKGPDVNEDIVIGQYVLIKPLQWTIGATFQDEKFWKTDQTNILATSENLLNSY